MRNTHTHTHSMCMDMAGCKWLSRDGLGLAPSTRDSTPYNKQTEGMNVQLITSKWKIILGKQSQDIFYPLYPRVVECYSD